MLVNRWPADRISKYGIFQHPLRRCRRSWFFGMNPFKNYILGISESEIELDTVDQIRDLVLAMAQQASRTLDIYSRDLDPRIYDTPGFADAAGRVAAGGKYSRVRILLLDEDPIVKHGHRLLELARRLSSYIEIRRIHEDYKHYNNAYLVADGRGYCYRELSDRFESVCNFNDLPRSRELTDQFNEVWEHSPPASALRRLYL